ncbi:sulfite reductase [NADPH] flavoprotein component [Coemansia erecta]|uniref:Sulfite reductase [NADPH] flavoprotein component n=1 Tax=Coemansia erecta TaxID=147472 RepID=A0A9W8CRJ1_9FUNG|nr:sulfite reductase [NADPH] flavoprotein component [Coemansia erecta]
MAAAVAAAVAAAAAAAAGSEAALATAAAPSSLMVGLQLGGRKAAVFGSGASAVTRATLALEAGASVVLYAADVAAALGRWADSGRVSTAAGTTLAAGEAAAFSVVFVADGVAGDAAAAIAQAARAGGAAVNVAGRGDLSDFALVPSYRGGGGLQVAVTTNGVAPRVAQRLLREIVARLPADLEPQLGEVARLGAAAAAAERAHAAAAAKLDAAGASDEAGLSTAATAAQTPAPGSEAGDAAAAAAAAVDLGALRRGAAVSLDAQAAVAYAAHALSDLCFVYAAAEQPVGAAALAWSRRAEKNAFGGWVSALRMQTRGGAGHALWGALAAGARVAALASGDSLAHMAGVLRQLAAQRRALVVHAEAQALDAAGAAHADHDAARAALATGAVVLASASPQEAHDVALVAHAVAAAARVPVVHVAAGDAQPAGVRTASHAQAARFVAAVAEAAGGSAGGAVDAAFALLRSTFGRTYARLEYSGPADAETVFVALGQPAAAAAEALPALLRQGAAAGVLTVRALRPWDAAALAASLPGSVRRVVVLPCTRGAAAGDALVADVALAALVGLPGRGVRVAATAVTGGTGDVAAAMAAALGLEPAEPAAEAAAEEEARPAQPAEAAQPAPAEALAAADVARMLAFPEAYGALVAARPGERTHTVRVSAKYRMTPAAYDRNIFHIEFDTRGTALTYEIGDALGVYGANDPALVAAFVDAYGLDADQLVAAARDGGRRETRSVRGWLTHALDLFGRPPKAFYAALADCAADAAEAERLRWLTTADGAAEFRARVADTATYADVLLEFASARPSAQRLVALVAPIKPRHYSIASSARMHPGSVHLCVVAVEWRDSRGRRRAGQCTRFLDALAPGDAVVVAVKPSVMKLPPLDAQPVVMAGLGTGMAPFRAFIEERAVRQQEGAAVGPMTLYFGSRHRAMEYLYGEELEAYHAAGLLTNLRLAFSRDQRDKVYIQHRMRQDAALLADHMLAADGAFYLCGPTWPAADVKDAMVAAFTTAGGVRPADASKLIEDLKERERYILEVY